MTASGSSNDPWAEAVAGGLRRIRASLGPQQRAAFDDLTTRLDLDDSGGAAYFLDPRAFPVVQLPTWCVDRASSGTEALPDRARAQLQEASLAGYLHVRVQDDLLDEGRGDPAGAMLLAEALLVRHLALVHRIAGSSQAFSALAESRWSRYGEAMLLEVEVNRGRAALDEEAARQLLDRSRPLVLPGAAALAAAGADEALTVLDAYVVALADGHQRFHDLCDAEADLVAGRRTRVTERYGGGGDPAVLRQRLVLGGGYDAVVGEARTSLERAAGLARDIGLQEAAADAERRIAMMAETQRALFEGLFHAMLEK